MQLFGRVVLIALASLKLFADELTKLFDRNLLAPTDFTIDYRNFRTGLSTSLVKIGMSLQLPANFFERLFGRIERRARPGPVVIYNPKAFWRGAFNFYLFAHDKPLLAIAPYSFPFHQRNLKSNRNAPPSTASCLSQAAELYQVRDNSFKSGYLVTAGQNFSCAVPE